MLLGYTPAQLQLGKIYAHDITGYNNEISKGTQDPEQALKWYKMAAKSGLGGEAQYRLGDWYLAGGDEPYVSKDSKLAIQYYEAAAKQGYLKEPQMRLMKAIRFRH